LREGCIIRVHVLLLFSALFNSRHRYMKTGVDSRGKPQNIKCVTSSLVRKPEKEACSLRLYEMFLGTPSWEWKWGSQGKLLGRELW